MPYVKATEFRRLQAADEACWSTLLMLSLGQLEVALPTRKFIADHGLSEWAHRCVEAGLLRPGDQEDR